MLVSQRVCPKKNHTARNVTPPSKVSNTVIGSTWITIPKLRPSNGENTMENPGTLGFKGVSRRNFQTNPYHIISYHFISYHITCMCIYIYIYISTLHDIIFWCIYKYINIYTSFCPKIISAYIRTRKIRYCTSSGHQKVRLTHCTLGFDTPCERVPLTYMLRERARVNKWTNKISLS